MSKDGQTSHWLEQCKAFCGVVDREFNIIRGYANVLERHGKLLLILCFDSLLFRIFNGYDNEQQRS